VNRFIASVATLGCIGRLPAGGTCATLAALPLADALARGPWWAAFAVFSVLCVLGVAVSAAAERHFGRVDDRRIVIDEVVGCLLTFLWIDTSRLAIVLIGFGLFRLLDIWKPGFRSVQRLSGGWGIMADDLVAGALANLLLRCIRL
jgi:phosphatidylglycerophosphatase A